MQLSLKKEKKKKRRQSTCINRTLNSQFIQKKAKNNLSHSPILSIRDTIASFYVQQTKYLPEINVLSVKEFLRSQCEKLYTVAVLTAED